MDLFGELAALLRAFDEAGVEYALCGALALAVHGVPRATKDIDLLATPGDLERVRAIARTRGFTLEGLPMTLGPTSIGVRRFTKLIEGRPLMLDVLLVDESLREVWDARQSLPWSEGTVKVVSRRGLVTLKLTAGRPQDLVDVQRLEELDGEAGDDR